MYPLKKLCKYGFSKIKCRILISFYYSILYRNYELLFFNLLENISSNNKYDINLREKIEEMKIIFILEINKTILIFRFSVFTDNRIINSMKAKKL